MKSNSKDNLPNRGGCDFIESSNSKQTDGPTGRSRGNYMQMKIIVNIVTCLLTILVFTTSCKKEDAAYTEIQQVSIAGIEDKYFLLNTESLTIRPELTQGGRPISEDNFEFLWMNLGDASITTNFNDVDTLTRTADLTDKTFKLASKTYSFLFKMTEKATGISYSKKIDVEIASEFRSGFMVLTEANNTSRLDMVVDRNGTFYSVNDILSRSGSALHLQGRSLFLSRVTNPFTGDAFYIGTSEGTNKVDLETFAYKPSMNVVYEFMTGNFTPDNFKPQNMTEGFMDATTLFQDNNIYVTSLGGGAFDVPINNFGQGNTRFKASKWMAPYMTSTYQSNFILFDEDAQKFYNYRNEALGVSELPTGTKFDYHIKKQLVYMGFSANNTGEIFAVLKDNNVAKYYLARFSAGYRTTVGEQISFDVLDLPEIEKASHFAISKTFGYLFYAVGDKLYSYDAGNRTVQVARSYPGRRISYIRVDLPHFLFSKESDFEGMLYVATYEEGNTDTSGQIDVLEPTAVQGPMTLHHQFKGLGKVVDILRLY